MEPNRDSTSLRVASFACYLDTAKDNIVHRVSSQETNPKPSFSINFSKPRDAATLQHVDAFSYLNKPIQDPTSAFTFSQHPSKDGEISIFGADKYFNMKVEHPNLTDQMVKQNNKEPVNPPPKVKPDNPSLRSESSSYNSQVPMMPILPKKIDSQVKQKRLFGRKVFKGFGCKGPCFNAKSICTNQTEVHHVSQPVKMGTKDQILEESRQSIEVFGSMTASKGSDVAANMERKLSMLSWDAIPKLQSIPTSTTVCDDRASEASSDLFEIENISGTMYPPMSSDDIPSCMMSPTSHYAPSEASIHWSIATASAVDYIIPSDYNDVTYMSIGPNINQIHGTTGSKGGGRSSSLLGCHNQKSVDVTEPHKANDMKTNQGLGFSGPFGRSLENKGRAKVDHIDTLHLPIIRSFTKGGLSS